MAAAEAGALLRRQVGAECTRGLELLSQGHLHAAHASLQSAAHMLMLARAQQCE